MSFSGWHTSYSQEHIRRLTMKCPECGSNEITAEAVVSWNPHNYSWEMDYLTNYWECTECEASGKDPENELNE